MSEDQWFGESRGAVGHSPTVGRTAGVDSGHRTDARTRRDSAGVEVLGLAEEERCQSLGLRGLRTDRVRSLPPSPASPRPNANASPRETVEAFRADLLLGTIYVKKTHYDSTGAFDGCWGKGWDCLVLPTDSEREITLSSEGVHMQ
jgi:hypothetical protein